MMQILHIKNMVCNRCKKAVHELLNKAGFQIISIELGKVVIEADEKNDFEKLKKELNNEGFELITETSEALIEKIKIALRIMLR